MKKVISACLLMITLLCVTVSYAGSGWSYYNFTIQNNSKTKICYFEPSNIRSVSGPCMTATMNQPFVALKPGQNTVIQLASKANLNCPTTTYVLNIYLAQTRYLLGKVIVTYNLNNDNNVWKLKGTSTVCVASD